MKTQIQEALNKQIKWVQENMNAKSIFNEKDIDDEASQDDVEDYSSIDIQTLK